MATAPAKRKKLPKKTAARWVVPALVAIAAFFAARWAFARPKVTKEGETPDTKDDAGKRGRGDSGSPRPAAGGVTKGRAREGVSYTVPDGWDPVRGLWISPDCEWVVEGPGWYFGLCLGPDGYAMCSLEYRAGWPWDAGTPAADFALVGTGDSIVDHLASDPAAGALGFVDNRSTDGWAPEDIARHILEIYAPMCADVDHSQWSPALLAWYDSLLARIVNWQEGQLTMETPGGP